DNNIISNQNVLYGYSAIPPESAGKTPSDEICYIFSGWDTVTTSITKDTQVKAVFTEVDRWYDVVFIGMNDEELCRQVVEYMHDAYDPLRQLALTVIDDDYIMAVVGWDKTFKKITSDLTVNAIYSAVRRWYRVSFFNEDGTPLKEERVEYGKSATAPATPSKPSTEDYRFVFAGWDTEYDYVTDDLDVFATYTKLENKFTVTFYDGDGKVFDEQSVFYGLDASQPDGIPTKTPTAMYTFTFTGWDKELTNITEDRKIYAQFSQSIRYYTVLFVGINGATLKEEQVAYGGNATPPDVTPPAPDQQYTYTAEWSPAYTNIRQDTIIRLSYKATVRDYTYTFFDHEGRIIKSVVAPYGSTIVPPADPVKPMTEKYTYKFVCWTPSLETTLTKDMSFTPYFEESIREYKVTFLDGDGHVFYEELVPYGSNGNLPPDTPTKSPTVQYYYVFKMWESYPNS
ncbi:MAG TPA: hypothetical protein PKY53_07240, partial [Clostridia bacterium]|nr:hypothetical protein [Clostridia bacterium]